MFKFTLKLLGGSYLILKRKELSQYGENGSLDLHSCFKPTAVLILVSFCQDNSFVVSEFALLNSCFVLDILVHDQHGGRQAGRHGAVTVTENYILFFKMSQRDSS